ncbi:DUF262 domain-containing protein [Floricoccus penangensis]|uniref:DUF262 domain-containing protein n=1 Tax=Floricoccus penangensis TaxID=1859475 RepID=UPI00203AF64F|nr:DUF262 domain-containing protein [Floricoccus penangensis]URZ86715.1 DUF262 domain-containing protein [Floricoccus penangensis]
MKQLHLENINNWPEITEQVEIFKDGKLIGNLSPNEPILTRNVKDIISEPIRYLIPAYQRGYRWGKKQVIDLLNDIWEWGKIQSKLPTSENTKYCLQPIVLKKNDTNKYDYDLVDGQQRLTSIYIILKALKALEVINQSANYSLSYETRIGKNDDSIGSEEFLKDYIFDSNLADKNIDFYHMNNAFQNALDWLGEDEERKQKWYEYLINENYGAFFIEYNATQAGDERSSERIFIGLNAGKISLVESELVKGLFLKTNNFSNNKAKLSIIEISTEWDRIERKLRDKNFWAWLGQDETDQPRIDYILSIVAKSSNFYSYFENQLNIENPNMDEIANILWLQVKQCFMTLEDWYDDFKTYHLIGFLNQIDKKKNKISNYYYKYLDDNLNFVEETNVYEILEKIDDISYGDKEVYKTLLFFNILTCIDNKIKFRFDDFRSSDYDIEHVSPHSQFDKLNKIEREEWLDEIKKSGLFNEELNKYEYRDFGTDDIFEQFYSDLTDSKRLDDIDSLGNLCLLDENTNRSYGNKPFPLKVKTIIEVDIDQNKGNYILPATKNVFLKYYSGLNINNITWEDSDAECYLEKIRNTLKTFMEKENDYKI